VSVRTAFTEFGEVDWCRTMLNVTKCLYYIKDGLPARKWLTDCSINQL